MRLIDANALYERTAQWEEQGRQTLLTLDPVKDRDAWMTLNGALMERSLFKHDIADAPTVDKDYYEMDEWCVDCKEYDHDKHRCPRFNHVIRRTIDEALEERKAGKWLPVVKTYKITKGQFPYTHIEWEDATKMDNVDAVKCSVCGEVLDFDDGRNYCPNCGARMVNVDD